MSTLFKIGEDLNALAELLEETGGDISDEATENAIDEFFRELSEKRDAKLDDYCALIKHFEARAKARKDEAERILALAKPDENSAKRLKERLQSFLTSNNIPKIETLRFKLAIQNNGGKSPVILDEAVIAHPEELPEGLRRVVFSPDIDAIRAILESGADLEFAKLGERGTHLRIR